MMSISAGHNVVDTTAMEAVEREIAVLFRRARAASSEMARELHPDLESEAYGLLAWLNRAGPSRLTHLAGQLGIGKGTMSRQIASLERLGLVQRRPDPADGRAALLEMTPAGRERFDRTRAARLDRLHRILDSWPAEDLAVLASLLHRLNTEVL
jgi:DNA-binding MarR family transcriptional regulator